MILQDYPRQPATAREATRCVVRSCSLVLDRRRGAGAWFYTGVDRPYKGYGDAEQFVEIPQGAGPPAMARRLADAGVVRT